MSVEDDYWKLAESEHHFNKIQAGIRERASTWLLITFAALAVLLQTDDKTVWLVPAPILIGLVCLMASTGLFILWINDQVVYQRLLNSVFLVGLKVEKDNPSILPIKTMMMHTADGMGMSKWFTFYYTVPMLFFLLITIIVTFFSEYFWEPGKVSNTEFSFYLLYCFCFIQAAITIWMQSQKETISTKQRAELFGDKEFESMFEGGREQRLKKFGDVIKMYSSKPP